MPHSGFTIYIVEDDRSVRDSLALLLSLQGYPNAMFADAESFLNAYRKEWFGCLLIDIRMPGMNGLALQKHLIEIGCGMPTIIMTGHGDVESAREAFLSHAVDFLEKPIDGAKLISAIDDAFARQADSRVHDKQFAEFSERLSNLTPREVQVMELVVAGQHNRDIADSLGISTRTVEVHKARLMMKLGVHTIPDLVRLRMSGGRPSSDLFV
ncbi:MAG: response regulator [Gallionellaceae bacterium]